jgi:peptidoglycan/LPS O-acetylase OafA/YrhL
MKLTAHNLTDRQTIVYLNGLKGFACLFVMIGHYLGIYKYAQSFNPPIHIIDYLKGSPFSFLIDEGYWLYLFFVVSGYLVAKSKITSIADLISKSISRFLRLAMPILFSYFVIYLIYVTVGFHTAATNYLFQCQWYQGYYTGTYTIKDVLLGPIYVLLLGKSLLNGPYWVLRMMFISSLIIYFLKLILFKLSSSKYESPVFSSLIIMLQLAVPPRISGP